MKRQNTLFTTLFAAAAVTLFLGHLVLYITWTSLFTIPTSDGRTILKVALVILGASFPITSFIVFLKETRFCAVAFKIGAVAQ